jgi:hypothetical protein
LAGAVLSTYLPVPTSNYQNPTVRVHTDGTYWYIQATTNEEKTSSVCPSNSLLTINPLFLLPPPPPNIPDPKKTITILKI